MVTRIGRLVKDIQYAGDLTIEQVANKIGYARPHLNKLMKTGDSDKVFEALQKEFKEMLKKEPSPHGETTNETQKNMQLLTQRSISQFYKDVKKLGLKFPVAVISRETGYSKGNVSGYLNGIPPSEKFLNAFYERFHESLSTGQESAQNKEIDKPINKPSEKLTTATKAPSFEMKASNGNSEKDTVIRNQSDTVKTLADTTKSQQETISKLTDLVTKLVQK